MANDRIMRLRTISAVTMLLYSLLGCGQSNISNGPRITSTSHLLSIGTAIRDYQSEKGMLPDRLSDLFPQYVASNRIAMFYVMDKLTREQHLPPGWETDPSLVDEHSSYVYLGSNVTHEVIAFERTNLWRASAGHSDKVAVLFSDYHVHDVPIVTLQQWLSGKATAGNEPEFSK